MMHEEKNSRHAAESALVIFSGGQDSATCLAWALNRFARVFTVGFTYGQRHVIEMQCRQDVLAELPALACRPEWKLRLAHDQVLAMDILGELSHTALTSGMDIAITGNGLPNTFVPGRNLMFLTGAAALAWRLGVRHLVMGVCEEDFSGYPDCRDDTVKAMQVALNLGMDAAFRIHTPLMYIDKAATWELARKEGGDDLVELVRTRTHTCYLGDRSVLHAWGYGCGSCPACVLREKGWASYSSYKR